MSETVNETTGEIVQVVSSENSLAGAIEQLQNGRSELLSTIKGDDFATRMQVLKAVSGSSALADNLGKTIAVAHVIVQPVRMENQDTGKMEDVPRVILIDDKGAAFHGISGPLFRDVKTLLAIAGDPNKWPTPIPLVVNREGQGARKYFTVSYK